MKKLIRSSIVRTFAYFLAVLLIISVVSFAQEKKKEETEKKYVELTGDYKFKIEGKKPVVKFLVENGSLRISGSGPTQDLIPAKGKELVFELHSEEQGIWTLTFMRDETGKITKCKMANKAMGMEIIGEKIIKEKKTEKVDVVNLYAEIAGDYEFDIPDEGKLTFNIYVEDGNLWGLSPTSNSPKELDPVKEKELVFEIFSQEQGIWTLTFMRDETGKITKCNMTNKDMEMDLTGKKK